MRPPPDAEARFDPRAVLAALQRAEVVFVLIGGLARVIRGSDEVTYGVDICPSLLPANRERLQAALEQLDAGMTPARGTGLGPNSRDDPPALRFTTVSGPLKIVATPAGVPRGYDALRPAASREHLGGGLRPEVASTGDLITMAAALGRREDIARIRELRRILELEADPAGLLTGPGAPEAPATSHAPYRTVPESGPEL